MADISKINVNSTEYNLKDAAARSQLGQLKTAAYKDITNSYDATSEDAISGKGVADAVEVETLTDTTPYVYRQSPAIGNRVMENALVGGSVAWNQRIENGDFSTNAYWGARQGTVAIANNIATVTPSSDGVQRGLTGSTINDIIVSHKWLISVDCLSPITSTLGLSFSGRNQKYVNVVADVWKTCSVIWTDNNELTTNNLYLLISGEVTTSQVIKYKNAYAIDLTALFGTTIADYAYTLETQTAGSGIAWLRDNGFDFSEYHDYDAGSLQSVCVSGKKVVGKNLFDKVTMVLSGYVSSNGIFSSSSSGEKCICVPAPKGTYNLSKIATIRTVIAYFANIPTNGQSGTVLNTAPYESVSVTIQNDGYIVAFIYNNTGETNTLQNVLDSAQLELGSTATTYEPYTEKTYPLDHKTLRGIFKLVNNKIVADGDVQSWDGVVTRKYGYRAYQSGDESLADAITDGTNTVYKLTTHTTEPSTPFENPQISFIGGTEEFTDYEVVQGNRDVAIPVGHISEYKKLPEWTEDDYIEYLQEQAEDVPNKLDTSVFNALGLSVVDGKLCQTYTT